MENKITVLGAGYVGLSVSISLARKNRVYIYDIDSSKLHKMANYETPIQSDSDITYFFKHLLKEKRIKQEYVICTDKKAAMMDANYIVVATPTNYDEKSGRLNINSIIDTLHNTRRYAPQATVIIRSTLPIGAGKLLKAQFADLNIFYVPEFSREGRSLADEIKPERLIIGVLGEEHLLKEIINNIADLFLAENKNEILYYSMSISEAEAVKLFSNTYLAMRVAFFNEIDSFSYSYGLSTMKIIAGVCADSRIGSQYNTPSFGYGGYCLPKDTKELKTAFGNIPEQLISATVSSNELRKKLIAEQIIESLITMKCDHTEPVIGIYRLVMKRNSDNFRGAAILEIIQELKKTPYKIIIFEPAFNNLTYEGINIIKNIDEFKVSSDIIVANRFDEKLNDVLDKVYTRDIFH
ncbi:nucleotide sugar dehydrogenase [Lacrimispora brassicae]